MTERAVVAPPETIGPSRSPRLAEDLESWEWLAILSVVAAGGLLALAVADNGGRNSSSWAEPVFWLGLLAIIVPCSLRLFSNMASRSERVSVVVILGASLYLVKVLHDPTSFTHFDEFSNWRSAINIVQTHHLFRPNPLQQILSSFPGLGATTSAVASISGLSLFISALLVVGVARTVLVLSLYLLYEQVGDSHRMAAVATLLYMANPSFLFFDSQYAYESLALPLAILTLLVAARRTVASARAQRTWTAISVLALATVVMTHHLTSYFLFVYFVLWAAAAACTRPRERAWVWPAVLALASVLTAGVWIAAVAGSVLGYLGTPVGDAASSLVRLVTGRRAAKQLNRTYTGRVALWWEQAASYGSVALILAGLALGLAELWRHVRASALSAVLAVVALGYPASLVLAFTRQGSEASTRASEYLFVGVAFVLAAYFVRPVFSPRATWSRYTAFALYVSVIFVGGIIVGWSPVARLPGPYLVGADSRSVDPEGIAAAEWARDFLGTGNRILADRTNRQLMGSYGMQDPRVGASAGHRVSEVFFSTHLGPTDRNILRADAIRYVVVDHRLSHALPQVGIYFERDEPGAYRHTSPISSADLNKFSGVNGVSRVFSDGHIAIYDVGLISGCPRRIGASSPC